MTGALAGPTLGLVGGIIQTIAASQAQKAMEKAFAKQLREQNAFSNEATQAFYGTLQNDSVENAKQQMAMGLADRTAKYDALPQLGLTPSSQRTGRVAQNVQSSGQALGRLGSYGDWQLNRDIANILQQDKIDKAINFAGGSASVFPYNMNAAQHSQDALAFLGQVISSIGGSAPAWGSMFQGEPTGVNGANTGIVPSMGGGYGVSNGFDYRPPNIISPSTGQGGFGTMYG